MAVSCKLQGGFSNNLFQMAAVIAYSLEHKMPYCIPNTIHNPHYEGQRVYNSPNISYCDKDYHYPPYPEPHFHFSPIPYFENLCLFGYWQSEKFFDKYLPEIRKAFNFDYSHTILIYVHPIIHYDI
jgi:hypothetical protein